MNKRTRISELIATILIIPMLLIICSAYITGCKRDPVKKDDVEVINTKIESCAGKNLTWIEANRKIDKFEEISMYYDIDPYILTADGEKHINTRTFGYTLDRSDEARYDITILEMDDNGIYKGIKVVQVNEPSDPSEVEETETMEEATETSADGFSPEVLAWFDYLRDVWQVTETTGENAGATMPFDYNMHVDIYSGLGKPEQFSIDPSNGDLIITADPNNTLANTRYHKIDENHCVTTNYDTGAELDMVRK